MMGKDETNCTPLWYNEPCFSPEHIAMNIGGPTSCTQTLQFEWKPVL